MIRLFLKNIACIRIRLVVLCCLILYLVITQATVEKPNFREHQLELKPMFITNLGSEISGGNAELIEFYSKNNLCGSIKEKYDSLIQTVNNYIQRYVSLLLIISGNFNQEAKDFNEMITIDLEITISPEDLAYLQNFAKAPTEQSVLKDLSRLDAILSKVVEKKKSYFEQAFRFSGSLVYYLSLIIFRLFVTLNNFSITPYLIIFIITALIYHFSSRRSFYIYLSILLNSMIIWDSLKLYNKKLKEAEIELETFRLRKMPPECDPEYYRWYHTVINIFSGDRCVEYYKMINSNPKDDVSLLKCIVDTYLFYTFRTPFKILGTSIRDFTGEISALWPTSLRWLINLPIALIVTIIVIFLILILFGKRFRMSFFGASVEIGDSTIVKETKIINKTQEPRLMANYRPLKISREKGKSRFFRSSLMDLVKRNKSIVKATTLECASEHEKKNDAKLSTASDSEIAKKQD